MAYRPGQEDIADRTLDLYHYIKYEPNPSNCLQNRKYRLLKKKFNVNVDAKANPNADAGESA